MVARAKQLATDFMAGDAGYFAVHWLCHEVF